MIDWKTNYTFLTLSPFRSSYPFFHIALSMKTKTQEEVTNTQEEKFKAQNKKFQKQEKNTKVKHNK